MENKIANGLEAKAANFAAIPPESEEMLNRIGQMTRGLHESLRGFGVANPLQDEITKQAAALQAHWNAVLEIPSVKSEYNEAAKETMAFIQKTMENINKTKAQLMQIMMAQDFQDLTGQVIKK